MDAQSRLRGIVLPKLRGLLSRIMNTYGCLVMFGEASIRCAGVFMCSKNVCAVCPNALKFNDPSCKNGGRLHADNSTHEEPERYNNCVQCDCPPQWTGIDCSCELRLWHLPLLKLS